MLSATRKICSTVQSFHVGVHVIVVNKTHSFLPNVTLNNRSLPRISCYGQLTTAQVLITKLQMCTGGGNTNKQLWRSQPQLLAIVKKRLSNWHGGKAASFRSPVISVLSYFPFFCRSLIYLYPHIFSYPFLCYFCYLFYCVYYFSFYSCLIFYVHILL